MPVRACADSQRELCQNVPALNRPRYFKVDSLAGSRRAFDGEERGSERELGREHDRYVKINLPERRGSETHEPRVAARAAHIPKQKDEKL